MADNLSNFLLCTFWDTNMKIQKKSSAVGAARDRCELWGTIGKAAPSQAATNSVTLPAIITPSSLTSTAAGDVSHSPSPIFDLPRSSSPLSALVMDSLKVVNETQDFFDLSHSVIHPPEETGTVITFCQDRLQSDDFSRFDPDPHRYDPILDSDDDRSTAVSADYQAGDDPEDPCDEEQPADDRDEPGAEEPPVT